MTDKIIYSHENFSRVVHDHNISMVQVSFESYIHGITFKYRDGCSKEYGEDSGAQKGSMTLRRSEHLSRIEVKHRDERLKLIWFHTSFGQSKKFGKGRRKHLQTHRGPEAD